MRAKPNRLNTLQAADVLAWMREGREKLEKRDSVDIAKMANKFFTFPVNQKQINHLRKLLEWKQSPQGGFRDKRLKAAKARREKSGGSNLDSRVLDEIKDIKLGIETIINHINHLSQSVGNVRNIPVIEPSRTWPDSGPMCRVEVDPIGTVHGTPERTEVLQAEVNGTH